jgi:DMSO reductase family type II enzyme heme b subunit
MPGPGCPCEAFDSATTIHANGPRAAEAFVPVDCASLPERALETVKPDQHALGKGVWKDGVWRVVITRPMVSDDLNAPRLVEGLRTVVSFAVWEGEHREVGARKAWAPWAPLLISRAAAPAKAPR